MLEDEMNKTANLTKDLDQKGKELISLMREFDEERRKRDEELEDVKKTAMNTI